MKLDIANSLRDQILCLGCLIIFWASAHYLCIKFTFRGNQVSQKHKIEAKILLTPLFHGLTTWLMATVLYPSAHYDQPNTSALNFVCFYSATYFMVDVVVYWKYGCCSTQLAIHHFCASLSLITPLIFSYGAAECVVGLAILEVTNFPLNVSTMLRYFQKSDTGIYRMTRTSFYLLYFISRFPLAFTVLYYPVYFTVMKCPLMPKIMMLGIIIQSFVVMGRILEIFKMKMSQFISQKINPEQKPLPESASIEEFFAQN